MNFDIATVAAIVVLCYLIGMGVKAYEKIDNKWIPVIVGLCGCLLGIAGMYLMPDFPAKDLINAAAVGAVSGLSAVGINQIGKQLIGG